MPPYREPALQASSCPGTTGFAVMGDKIRLYEQLAEVRQLGDGARKRGGRREGTDQLRTSGAARDPLARELSSLTLPVILQNQVQVTPL